MLVVLQTKKLGYSSSGAGFLPDTHGGVAARRSLVQYHSSLSMTDRYPLHL